MQAAKGWARVQARLAVPAVPSPLSQREMHDGSYKDGALFRHAALQNGANFSIGEKHHFGLADVRASVRHGAPPSSVERVVRGPSPARILRRDHNTLERTIDERHERLWWQTGTVGIGREQTAVQ